MSDIAKTKLRKEALDLLKGINNKPKKSKIIIRKLISLDLLDSAENILLYSSTKNEIDTSELMELSLQKQKKLFFPFVDTLSVGQITDPSQLIEGNFSIKIPDRESHIDLKKINLVILPGLLFDKQGYRLGHGSGWYDRFLTKLDRSKTKIIGLCYDAQILKKLPTGKNDQKIDLLISESQILIFNKNF
jgi:5-formyltetrahydrofolate cyclo-ligase